MGANGDAGTLTIGSPSIGSPSISFGALHVGDPVRAPRADNLALIRDYPSCVGNLDLREHLKRVDPSEMCTVSTKVYADDLPSGPAVTLRAICEPAQAVCLVPPKAPALVAARTSDYLKACRPPVGR